MPLFCSSLVLAGTCNSNIIKLHPDEIYTDNSNGTVTDNMTGLIWQKCSAGQIYDQDSCTGTATQFIWENAFDAAKSANTDNQFGFNDWRLPNKNELASLVERACYSPSINQTIFPATHSHFYWTSSPVASNFHTAWQVAFTLGYLSSYTKTNNNYVRLVRGGL